MYEFLCLLATVQNGSFLEAVETASAQGAGMPLKISISHVELMCRRVCRELGNIRGFSRAQGWRRRGLQRKISVLAEGWMRQFCLVWMGAGACPWQCALLSSGSGHRHLCVPAVVAFTSPRLHGLGKIAFPRDPLQPSPAVRQDQPASGHHLHFNTNGGANLSKDIDLHLFRLMKGHHLLSAFLSFEQRQC